METGLRSGPTSLRTWRGHGGSRVSDSRKTSIRKEWYVKFTGSRGLRRRGGARQCSLRQQRGSVQKAEGKKHLVKVRIQKQEARGQEPEP